jgi:hypothetical protein
VLPALTADHSIYSYIATSFGFMTKPSNIRPTSEFKWVKAHARIYGNEIADRLAKEATQNYYVTYSRIPRSAIKKDTRK